MRLLTNKNNSSSLKILIAGECSGKNLELVILDKPAYGKLPCFYCSERERDGCCHLGPNVILFICNKMCYYVYNFG